MRWRKHHERRRDVLQPDLRRNALCRQQFLEFFEFFVSVRVEIDVSLFAHPAGFLGCSKNARSMFVLST
jgi:hypothetical protein